MGAGMAPGAAAGIAAAVLVPLMRRAGDLTVLLTVRAATLADHAGQISFPGGRIEPTDADVTAAALRETWEEVGIAADCVDVFGCLPAVATGSGFFVTPVVAVVQSPASLRLAPDEVAEAFEVPLEFVLDVHNYARETAFLRGRQRTYSALRYRGRRIWGATAAILRSLADGDAAAAMPMYDGASAQGGGA